MNLLSIPQTRCVNNQACNRVQGSHSKLNQTFGILAADTHSKMSASTSADVPGKLLMAFDAIRILLLPCAWLESLCLGMAGVDTATPFRMFPTHDPHPGYPASECNALALGMMLLIPWLVASEARPNCRAPAPWLLRPLTRRCNRLGACVLMLIRVWIYMACFNHYVAELLRDPFRMVITCFKISSMVFIL